MVCWRIIEYKQIIISNDGNLVKGRTPWTPIYRCALPSLNGPFLYRYTSFQPQVLMRVYKLKWMNVFDKIKMQKTAVSQQLKL